MKKKVRINKHTYSGMEVYVVDAGDGKTGAYFNTSEEARAYRDKLLANPTEGKETGNTAKPEPAAEETNNEATTEAVVETQMTIEDLQNTSGTMLYKPGEFSL